ncbi:putative F-box protein At1g67623 [Hibiscus syriacus]|uniref:putative F-box protein At1g67623 n=1 Tax=Hibiscus syriacus TaxID=106335 RepID=UPI001922018A|nr:putative F-box protein At1g67623 [Hibiscus syriacus]
MANNPQALYREGMVKCFCDVNYDVDCGVRLLREASDRGVIEATYALGLQLICIESRASEGYRVLQDLDVIYFEEGFDVITRCRRVTNRMIADIWTTSQLEPLKRVYCPCIDDPDRCSYCFWNYEAEYLADLLERRNYGPLPIS